MRPVESELIERVVKKVLNGELVTDNEMELCKALLQKEGRILAVAIPGKGWVGDTYQDFCKALYLKVSEGD